jgi:hypothetical protein
METGSLINIIPNDNQYIVIYRGQVVENVTGGGVGIRAHIIDGKLVPDEDLDAWYVERMMFDWRGQPFELYRYQNGRVYGSFHGTDNSWAEENGLEGDSRDGYFLDVSEREIDNVRVVRHDSLASNLYRHTFNVDPPKDLFVTVRPATDQEWIKE